MRLIIILAFSCFLAFVPALAVATASSETKGCTLTIPLVEPTTYIYQNKTETVVVKSSLSLIPTQHGYLVETANLRGKTSTYTLPNLEAYSSSYTSPAGQTKITIERKDGNLVFSGTNIKGDVDKTVPIGQVPWYESPYLLNNFILSDKDEIEFYVAQARDVGVTKFKAAKEKEEQIEVNGQTIEAVKVKLTFADWRSFFWSSFFWYRKADGVFVKSKERLGPPGTAETKIELIS